MKSNSDKNTITQTHLVPALGVDCVFLPVRHHVTLEVHTRTAAVDVLLKAAATASQAIQNGLCLDCLTAVDVKHHLETTAAQLAANIVKVLCGRSERRGKGNSSDGKAECCLLPSFLVVSKQLELPLPQSI